ncbi:lecithin retinol acyltransferase family protein [Fulvivirgaceae bacterium PWU4]|uniref:Lecithin retinol acyltransferase family protein n=1 Tax=Chryseosolibacter histidini TaxID=2782349 RepID=A0AAP2DJ33_9BACT|nr:lecithin retinol acyltransferase family protein [Chryseosolibacter histidini]MBT1697140.1 lecithin retinol acyltransferase family protein [Chryseosolibacter histidini]
MSIHQFIIQYGVRPADAIVLQKRFFGMVDHFVIYIGIIDLQHAFVANYIHGVRVISNNELETFLAQFAPSKIEKYPGPENQRSEALKRAMSQIGQKAYNYLANNCEHFKNFVHYGIKKSTQVQKAGGVLALGGLGVALMGVGKKNDGLAVFGFFIILIGIIVAILGAPPGPNNNRKQ